MDSSFIGRMVAPFSAATRFSGRSTRGEFWPYMLSLVILYIVVFVIGVAAMFNGVASPVAIMFPALGILILLAWAAVARRMHDVDWSGRWMTAYVVATFIFIALFFCFYAAAMTPGSEPQFGIMIPAMAVSMIANVLGLLILVICVLEGTRGDNRFGPDPLDKTRPIS
jgi:uncharacterized membrane protein YhaH (DUF805 family)